MDPEGVGSWELGCSKFLASLAGPPCGCHQVFVADDLSEITGGCSRRKSEIYKPVPLYLYLLGPELEPEVDLEGIGWSS